MSGQEPGPLARELNRRLEAAAPEVSAMLSALGRRLFFPKGILAQSAEARRKASRINATIGIATEKGGPMFLPSVHAHLRDLDPADVYPYAPPAGRLSLRERWRDRILRENPSLRGKRFGLPVVTSALTHGLTLAGELFVDPGDPLLVPDKLWGNYRLIFGVRLGARLETFPLFDGGGFHVGAFEAGLARLASPGSKLLVLLNFPHNPTGYMPTPAEGERIVQALVASAERGARLVVLLDDAYFGLFYHLGGRSLEESLFGPLTNAHPNLLALKIDGATKEFFVWGLRCGFLTVGPGRAQSAEEVCDVLDAKLRGAIRGSISNSPHLSQTLVERALASPSIGAEREAKRKLLEARARRIHQVVQRPEYRESFEAYPFNSGYFMCVRVKGVEAERVREHLLENCGIGVIAASETDLRIAFSCLEEEAVETLFDSIHRAVQELR